MLKFNNYLFVILSLVFLFYLNLLRYTQPQYSLKTS